MREPELLRPHNLEELEQAVLTSHCPLYVAGSTDLMLQPHRWQNADYLIDLTCVDELKSASITPQGGALLGSAMTLSNLMRATVIMDKYPLLRESCRQIGSIQIQNRATLGGNIANASPAGDSLPVLSVCDAVLWLGPRVNGEFERVPLESIMRAPGKTSLRNRYIAFIELPPLAPGAKGYFRKVGQRFSLAISKLSLAVIGWTSGNKLEDVRISAGSVSPVVARARTTEDILRGKTLSDELIEAAVISLYEEVSPISDIRSTESYRRKICGAALADALHSLLK